MHEFLFHLRRTGLCSFVKLVPYVDVEWKYDQNNQHQNCRHDVEIEQKLGKGVAGEQERRIEVEPVDVKLFQCVETDQVPQT